MPDPYAKVQEGQRVNPISTTTWNGFIDAARDFRARQLGNAANGPTTTRRADIVRVLNNTGDDVDRYGILGLDAPIILPVDNLTSAIQEPTFNGVVPAAEHKDRFAIMLEPTKDGQIGRGYVSGVCWVQVDIRDVDHRAADAKVDDVAALTSKGDGAVQILWKESDTEYGYSTGLQWAIVRFQTPGPKTTVAKATSTISHAANVGAYGAGPRAYGTGTALIQTDDGTQLQNSTHDDDNITVKNLTNFDIVVDSYMIIGWALGSWWVLVPDMCADIMPYS
jgi:hypothetical protein